MVDEISIHYGINGSSIEKKKENETWDYIAVSFERKEEEEEENSYLHGINRELMRLNMLGLQNGDKILIALESLSDRTFEKENVREVSNNVLCG